MINYDKLVELKDDFLNALQKETRKAITEKEMDELETIAEDALLGIPTNLIQKDFYKRSDIRTFLDDKDKDNTEYINDVMQYLFDIDTISFSYDMVNQAIEDDLEQYDHKKGAKNG